MKVSIKNRSLKPRLLNLSLIFLVEAQVPPGFFYRWARESQKGHADERNGHEEFVGVYHKPYNRKERRTDQRGPANDTRGPECSEFSRKRGRVARGLHPFVKQKFPDE